MQDRPISVDRELIVKNNIIIKLKLDARSIIEFANNEFVNLTGYDIGDIISRNFDFIKHPDTPETICNHLWENILSNKDTYLIAKFIAKSNAYFWLQVKFNLNLNETTGGIESMHLLCTKVNLNKKKQLEKIYTTVLNIEKRSGLKVAENYFSGILEEKDQNYNDFIHSFYKN